jgi:hypothetical protein
MTTSPSQGEQGQLGSSIPGSPTSDAAGRDIGDCRGECARPTDIDVRKLRADAASSFARAGIQPRFVDTAVVKCLIVMNTRPATNPLSCCLAIGRRLQDESIAGAVARWREFQRRFASTCPHGKKVEACPDCAQDRARAVEMFPALRSHLPASQRTEDRRA